MIKRVEQLCRNFPWQGKDGTIRGAKARWDAVCWPLSEGGLGIRRGKGEVFELAKLILEFVRNFDFFYINCFGKLRT